MGPFGLKKRKNTKKKILVISGITATVLLIAAFLFMLIYTGNVDTCGSMQLGVGLLECKAEEKYVYDEIAIVVGNTKNVPLPSLTKEAEKYIRNSSYKHEVDVSIYSVASNHAHIRFDDPGVDKDDEGQQFANKINEKINNIQMAIKKGATANGAEYLDTIIKANNNFSSDKPLIIVVGSGLSDGGILDFTQGDLIHGDYESIIDQMLDSGSIVSGRLKGTDIYWSGIGAVESPQTTLTEPEIDNLKGLYQTALKSMGGKVIKLAEEVRELNAEEEEALNEYVKENKIVLPKDTPYTVGRILTDGYKCDWCGVKTFDSNTIGFAEDSAAINEQIAMGQIGGLIEEMKRNKNERVEIVGYVSLIKHDCSIAESHNVDKELAKKRADAVKSILVKNGVPEGRIDIDYENSGKGPYKECADGRYDSDIAKKNMIITIKVSA